MARILPIDGYEGLYSVTDEGRVYSHLNNCYLKPFHLGIYQQVVLRKAGKSKNAMVHRLVAKAYIPNPLGLPEVNHIKGSSDSWDNLEWTTRQGKAILYMQYRQAYRKSDLLRSRLYR
jgi:hypothetical protein